MLVFDIQPILSVLFPPQYGDLQAYGDSYRLGLVFGRIMKKRYPQVLEVGLSSISLDDLLSWSHWPDFLKLYSMMRFYSDCIFTVIFVVIDGSSKAKNGLPDNCLIACSCAFFKLEEILGHIHDGSITVHQLQMIHGSDEQMKRLCNAMPVEAQKSLQGVELHTALNQKLDEYRMFSQQLECLNHLCHTIDPEICGKRNPLCLYSLAEPHPRALSAMVWLQTCSRFMSCSSNHMQLISICHIAATP